MRTAHLGRQQQAGRKQSLQKGGFIETSIQVGGKQIGVVAVHELDADAHRGVGALTQVENQALQLTRRALLVVHLAVQDQTMHERVFDQLVPGDDIFVVETDARVQRRLVDEHRLVRPDGQHNQNHADADAENSHEASFPSARRRTPPASRRSCSACSASQPASPM